MAFKRFRGKTKFMYWPGDTATEVRDGSLVGLSDSGTVVYANNDTTDRILGVARLNDTITDSSDIPVEVPVENAVEWLIDIDSDGGAVDSDVGRYCAVDTVGGGSVLAGDSAAMRLDRSDTVIRQILITKIISSRQVLGVIAKTGFNWMGHGGADTASGALADEDTA